MNIAPSYEYSTHSISPVAELSIGNEYSRLYIIYTNQAQRINYEQFGLAGLRADRVNGMCGIVSVAQHCTTTL